MAHFEGSHKLPDGDTRLKGVAKVLVELRCVVISPSLFCNHQVSIFDQVMDNTLYSPLGDLHAFCHIAYPHIGVTADEEKHMAVIGEKGPA